MRQRCKDCVFYWRHNGSDDCCYGGVLAPVRVRNNKIKSVYHYNSCPKYKKRRYSAGRKRISKDWYSLEALNNLWKFEVKY